MKIKITRGFCLTNGKDVFPGDVVEVSDATASLLIRQGRAMECAEAAEPEPKPKKGTAK